MKTILALSLLLFFHTTSFSQVVNPTQIKKFITYCDSTKADEVLISHKGKIITHWKRTTINISDTTSNNCLSPYMLTASMVKSWVGLLIGILIDKKLINSEEDQVCKYLPDWEYGCTNQITIKHLLTMTAGFNRLGGAGVLSKANANQYVLQLKPSVSPGARFNYSNESVQLLAILIEKLTMKKLDIAFNKYLFTPMEMDSTTFSKDSIGNIIAFGGCKTTVRNAHKIGLLMLNKGIYNGKRIVSPDWIDKSIMPNPTASFYGYLWWLDNNSKHKNYAATGDLGQMTIVFPDLELIFIRKQYCDQSPSSRNMTWMGPAFLQKLSSIIN